MDIEKDKALCKKYPNLYRDRNRSPRETCMCWGFTCGDGWYDIIDELSAVAEEEIVRLKNEGVPEEDLPVAAQVKQKYAGLRFYLMCSSTDAIDQAIRKAEKRSFITCENCGEPGKLKGRHWVKTLCEECNGE